MASQSRSSGFSLWELVAGIAIIAVIALMLMPSYQQFRSRARHSEAKTNLSAAYAAQRGFHGSYGTYHEHLPAIGFVPIGYSRYVRSGLMGDISGRHYYSVASNLTKCQVGYFIDRPQSLSELGVSIPEPDEFMGFYPSTPDVCLAGTAICGLPHSKVQVDSETFTLEAYGCPSGNLRVGNPHWFRMDAWRINHERKFEHFQVDR